MTSKGVEHRPSETAMFAALRRTIANKEFAGGKLGPDYLAEIFLPGRFRFLLRFAPIRANTKRRLNEFLPGLTEYMIARTVHFDGLFMDALNSNTPQIVLLGAGYDSRAYRYADACQDTRIFELDSAPTQERKRMCLEKAGIKIPPRVTFAPIDFNRQSLKDVLEEVGFQVHQKTLFIWEGVSYYLDAAAVDATLEFVGRSPHEETLIAFDYTVKLTEESRNDLYGAEEFAQTMKAHHASEELQFSIVEEEVASFLEGRNLSLVEHLDHEEIESRYLVDDSGALIGHMTGHFRFVSASAKGKLP